MRFSCWSAAIVASLVGFGGSVAIVIAATQAVGASPGQAASWLIALAIAGGLTGGLLSWRYRMPIMGAWSTPGAALIASGETVTINAAVGAFVFSACLMVLTALWRWLGDLISRIPAAVASAMLAGILLAFVLAAFKHLADAPWLVLPLIVIFVIVRMFNVALAVITVLVAGIALTFALDMNAPITGDGFVPPELEFIQPAFDPAVILGLGLPLYLVTMASQNLPGFAVLKAAGYQPPVRAVLAGTGLSSLLTAPFGAHATCLAAITAAMCTGPEAHPDPEKRWWTGIAWMVCWLIIAALSSSLIVIMAAMPVALIATVAGLALITPLTGALAGAMQEGPDRFAAMVTFAVTASGLAVFGIGSAFWGLAAGLAVLGMEQLKPR